MGVMPEAVIDTCNHDQTGLTAPGSDCLGKGPIHGAWLRRRSLPVHTSAARADVIDAFIYYKHCRSSRY